MVSGPCKTHICIPGILLLLVGGGLAVAAIFCGGPGFTVHRRHVEMIKFYCSGNMTKQITLIGYKQTIVEPPGL